MLPTLSTPAIAAVAFFSLITHVVAGFSSSSGSNVAIYWGQNSHGAATGSRNDQQRLLYYCSNTEIDVIPLAFLNVISDPSVNFANANDNCTTFSGSALLDCPQLEEDIQACQSTYGKTILLSIGGATYTEGGFSSVSAAKAAADKVWAMFGPAQSGGAVDRPFGKAVVDGFDFDFESSTSNMATFALEIRSKMDAATAAGDKSYFLSAAPQCPYPDVADNEMLAGVVPFDFVMVQFYNNQCGLQSFVSGSSTQSSFNFGTWDTWAKTVSKNPAVRIFLGIPGSPTAAGSGYVSGSVLAPIISYAKQFSSFGGVMIWDMTQVYANAGFLDQIAQALGSGASSPSSSTHGTATATTSTSTLARSSSTAAGPVVSSSPSVGSSTTQSTTATPYSTTTATLSVQGTRVPNPFRELLVQTTFSTITRSALRAGGSAETRTDTVTHYTTVSGSTNQAIKPDVEQTGAAAPAAEPSPATGVPVKQWGQCGGTGYTGSTQCESPYACVQNSVWWAQCQ